jgi:Protein of unknown function (DUF3168)
LTHPIVALQGALVSALRADATLAGLIGSAVFDAPPRGQVAPYVVIARHDLLPRDGDETPGNEHRVTLNIWHPDSSRKSVLAIADAAVLLDGALSPAGLLVTFRNLDRTDTSIDLATGAARAVLTLRFFSEPAG